MIIRERHLRRLEVLLAGHPVVAILGARQVGKTTLARQLGGCWTEAITWFDLENPDDLARMQEPMLALRSLEGLVVIDEVQRRPDLFPILRVLVDRPDSPSRFLVLGSASPDLLRQSSETLAGRIVYHELGGFALDETDREAWQELWLRGGFPRSFLAPTGEASTEWRRAFIQTILERDIPQLGFRIPGPTLHRFWRMLAHYHGQVWNGAELARAFGVSAATVRRYVEILEGALVVRSLTPWHANLSKRQVKSPKIYIRDAGLLHTLLGIETRDDLLGHPKVGASWEGFVLPEITRRVGARPDECHFWATHSGAEVDLLVLRGRHRVGFEVKRTTAPRTTRSMHYARTSLALDHLYVIHAGDGTFPIGEDTTAVAFERIDEDLPPIG